MDYTVLEESSYNICYLKYNDYAIAKLIQEYCMENERVTIKNPVKESESKEAYKYYRPVTFNPSFWRLRIKNYEEGNKGVSEVLKILKDAQEPIFTNINARLKGYYTPYYEIIKTEIVYSCQLAQFDIENEETKCLIDETTHELLALKRLEKPTNMNLNESVLAQKCLEIAIASSGYGALFRVNRLNISEGIAQKYE